ncbi:MAG: response regulator transcription factor [Armatimonadota bacterium]
MRIRLICFDDHPIVREGLVAYLCQQPELLVLGAYEGFQDFLNSDVTHQGFDVALVDVLNPSSPGPQLVKQLIAFNPTCRVIALSSSDDPIHKSEMLRRGASEYLLKSTTGRTLLKTIIETMAAPPVGLREQAPDLKSIGEKLQLSAKELEVFSLISEGLSNAEISKLLFISESTVKTHVSNLLAKVGVESRSQLVVFAWKTGFER